MTGFDELEKMFEFSPWFMLLAFFAGLFGLVMLIFSNWLKRKETKLSLNTLSHLST